MNIQDYLSDLRSRLRDSPATREQIALATDGLVSSSWVNKFAAGRMKNPRVDSLVALEQALAQIDVKPSRSAA